MSAPLSPADPPSGDAARRRRNQLAVGLAVVVLALAGGIATWGDLVAQSLGYLGPSADEEIDMSWLRPFRSAEVPQRTQAFAFKDLPQHPDRLYGDYVRLASPMRVADPTRAGIVGEFQALLEIYELRQGVDDNFTIRVLDSRTNEVLELYTLSDHRARYLRGEWPASMSWFDLDKHRRIATRQLVDKYVEAGIPKKAIMVRWGRANQIREAREREAPFIEYEIQLASYLGLSLLATEIGTVETFNTDNLVSSVGARSRYQMMPYLLRKNRIHHYRLETTDGTPITVYEEWHPLLTMEPAFLLMRAYANAVGHELPGLSAYHTGPYNIYKIYQQYLTEVAGDVGTADARAMPSVLDAYIWGLTKGFDQVARTSSFKNHSRAYIPSIIGALRATDDLPVDTTRTLQVEVVQLRPGTDLLLRDILNGLAPLVPQLNWGPSLRRSSLYDRFRILNPHIDLPALPDTTGVAAAYDLRFVHEVDDAPVRFFVPIGATEALRAGGLTALDPTSVVRYDRDRYAIPRHEVTDADRAYAALLQDIERFGFTNDNRAQLNELAATFRSMARNRPTPYRLRQQAIIEQHRQIWSSERWERLAKMTASTFGQARAPIQPPDPLGDADTQ